MKTFLLLAFTLGLAAQVYGATFSTDIDATLAAARKEKKPLVISFFGIWCPPCNELEETVFEDPRFETRSKHFKLLKVDADHTKAWMIKNRFRVGGYPTVVFADSTGEEINRVVGLRTPKEFFRMMDTAANATSKPLSKACESTNGEDLWRCAVVCSERKDVTCAEKAYKKLETLLKPGTVRYEEARGYAVEHSPTDDLKQNGYVQLLNEFSESPRALFWAADYLTLFDDKPKLTPKKDVVEKVLSHFPTMLADPRNEEFGYARTDLLEVRAELLEKLGKHEEAKGAWKDAAKSLENFLTQYKGRALRGYVLERISCLESSGDTAAALKLADEYRAKYPEEFTFHFAAASVLERSKRYKEALPVAEKAYKYSYGDNRIRTATLLIKVMQPLSDKQSAKKIFEDVIKDIQPDASLEVRTHRYLKKMREEWDKFGKS